MLRKSDRIPRSRFASILASRNFKTSPHFILRIAEGKTNSPQAAVSVSKKVSKSAVVRNRIRRRTYAALPLLMPGLYLVTAKPGSEKIKGEGLRQELAQLFEKR